jgi:flavin-dependent dehydrogenase
MERFDVIIIGAGPSGLSTAMSLQRRDPALAARTLLLERDHHPRHKLCGGGVTFSADPVLAHLGLSFDALQLPHVPIHTVRVRFEDKVTDVHFPNVFRIVRRDLFDAALANEARARGLQLREGVKVRDLIPEGGGVRVLTDQGELFARAVVGADGAKSLVRRKMDLPDDARVSRLIEILTPEDPNTTPEFLHNTAVFDFTPTRQRVQGYYWDFPSLKDGRAWMNRGVFDSRVLPHRDRADLPAALAAALDHRGVDLQQHQLQGHPERWFDPKGRYSAPHMLLVGDAAGVEPLLGEGIAWALLYGPTAADALLDAFQRDDLSFSTWDRRLASSPLGRQLALRTRLALFCYNRDPRLFRLLWPGVKLASRYLARRSRGQVTL